MQALLQIGSRIDFSSFKGSLKTKNSIHPAVYIYYRKKPLEEKRVQDRMVLFRQLQSGNHIAIKNIPTTDAFVPTPPSL